MRFIILLLSISLFGCSQEPQPGVSHLWYDLPNVVDELVVNMNTKNHKTIKTFILNSDTETKTYDSTDSTFWALELAKLKEIDLNSPQIRDVLSVKSSIKDESSNLLINEYLMPEGGNSSLKKLNVYYLKDTTEIRKIYVELNSDNLISNSGTKINLWVNRYDEKLLIDSLQIVGCDKTFMQPEREYRITTKTTW